MANLQEVVSKSMLQKQVTRNRSGVAVRKRDYRFMRWRKFPENGKQTIARLIGPLCMGRTPSAGAVSDAIIKFVDRLDLIYEQPTDAQPARIMVYMEVDSKRLRTVFSPEQATESVDLSVLSMPSLLTLAVST